MQVNNTCLLLAASYTIHGETFTIAHTIPLCCASDRRRRRSFSLQAPYLAQAVQQDYVHVSLIINFFITASTFIHIAYPYIREMKIHPIWACRLSTIDTICNFRGA